MSDAPTSRVTEKRRRVLQAALSLLLREGIKGTSMEAIAREAGIAKATLYAQFADKEAVLGGILEDLSGALSQAFDAGMASPAPLPQRIGAAMAGKYGVATRLVAGSPFARELLSSHGNMPPQLHALDERNNQQILSALRQAGVADPAPLNRLIQAACYGVAQKMIEETAVRAAIMQLCERLIAPELRG